MDKRSLVLFFSGLVAAGAVVGIAASCSDQPRIKCTAGHGPFAVKYFPAPGSTETCGLLGETVGVEAYNYPLADRSNLDPNRGSLGLQASEMDHAIAAHHAGSDAGTPYSVGDWSTPEPGSDNFCTVPTLNVAEVDLPAVAESDAGPAIPAGKIRYSWSNVRVYNEPRAPGNQLVADLEYTLPTADGGLCTAKVRAIGLWPAISCMGHEETDDGGMRDVLDPTLCNPEADLSKDRPLGSGISPDIDWTCDPELALCVLKRDPPSFK